VNLVLDASAGFELLLGTVAGHALLQQLPAQIEWWVPEHYFVETASAIRRAENLSAITPAQAAGCLRAPLERNGPPGPGATTPHARRATPRPPDDRRRPLRRPGRAEQRHARDRRPSVVPLPWPGGAHDHTLSSAADYCPRRRRGSRPSSGPGGTSFKPSPAHVNPCGTGVSGPAAPAQGCRWCANSRPWRVHRV